jgi:hypothetical protein
MKAGGIDCYEWAKYPVTLLSGFLTASSAAQLSAMAITRRADADRAILTSVAASVPAKAPTAPRPKRESCPA